MIVGVKFRLKVLSFICYLECIFGQKLLFGVVLMTYFYILILVASLLKVLFSDLLKLNL
jgi:hypothetical protein